jgi:hypothetical protein
MAKPGPDVIREQIAGRQTYNPRFSRSGNLAASAANLQQKYPHRLHRYPSVSAAGALPEALTVQCKFGEIADDIRHVRNRAGFFGQSPWRKSPPQERAG